MKVEIEKMDTTGKGALHPLFMRYDGQSEPQKAYITFDPIAGSVSADWSGEIGEGIPAAVWEGTVLRWRVSHELTAEEINDLMESFRSQFQALTDVVETLRTHFLENDPEAFRIKEAIGAKMDKHFEDSRQGWGTGGVWEVGQWLEDWVETDGKGVEIDSTNAELEGLAKSISDEARLDGVTLDGDVLEYLQDIRDEKIEDEKNEQLRY